MKQRYTNFSHASSKNTTVKKHAKLNERTVVENTETEIVEYTQTANASETGPVVFVKQNLINPVKTDFKNRDSYIWKGETGVRENAETEFNEKKDIDKKTSVAQRVIGTILKIVLWTIILAVVIGIIIIIVLA